MCFHTVSGNWGAWLPWEQCSVSCDLGERVRRRLCDNPRPQFGGDTCDGDELQIEPCNVQPCSGKILSIFFRFII